MKNLITAGRKRGCGACGQSESHESMQLNSILPWNSIIEPIRNEVPGARDDLPEAKKHSGVLVCA